MLGLENIYNLMIEQVKVCLLVKNMAMRRGYRKNGLIKLIYSIEKPLLMSQYTVVLYLIIKFTTIPAVSFTDTFLN